MQVHVVTVPYRYDQLDEGLGLGPCRLVNAGLLDVLAGAGHEVTGQSDAHLPEEQREEGRTAVNIGRLGSASAALVAEHRANGEAVLVVAGDDTATIGVVAGLQQADGAATPLGVVWFDAHGDFNTPETSYSGILAGMPVAILAGLAGPRWREAAGILVPIATDRIVIAGLRDVDEKEEALLRSTDVQQITAGDLRAGRAFEAAIARLTASCRYLYVNVDLDVLDPHLVPSSTTPAPDGLELDEAVAAIGAVLDTGKVAALSLTSLNPLGGQRGERAVQTALELVGALAERWRAVPSLPTGLPR
jgi:arginase